MSKAILVLDEMPTCCRECPLYIGGMYGKGITKSFVTMCGANHSEDFEDVTRYRLHSCPLKEAPESKSEWQKDREILKAYSDGANGVLDELRAEIAEEKEHAYADFERYKVEYLGQDWEDALDSLPQDEFRYGMERCIYIINKYKTESEKQMQPERDCVNCVYSKDGHISFSETCNNCMWKNQFIPKFKPKRIKASDIKPDDEWMKENEWDEIYAKENLPDINVGNIKESEE